MSVAISCGCVIIIMAFLRGEENINTALRVCS